MQIEVGKSYRTRDGRKADIYMLSDNGNPMGDVEGIGKRWWYRSGEYLINEECGLDLISPWDQPSSNIAERKMDVNVGDRVTIEGTVVPTPPQWMENGRVIMVGDDRMVVPLSAIKSVEPAPPAVGDRLLFDGSNNVEATVLAIDGSCFWMKQDDGIYFTTAPNEAGFRIVKRKGE